MKSNKSTIRCGNNKCLAQLKFNDDNNMQVMEEASKFAGNKKCMGKFLMQFKNFKYVE